MISNDGVIIYSTCSIFKDENEKILEKFKDFIEIIPINIFENNKISILSNNKGTITICPNEYYEGFFIAKLKKLA